MDSSEINPIAYGMIFPEEASSVQIGGRDQQDHVPKKIVFQRTIVPAAVGQIMLVQPFHNETTAWRIYAKRTADVTFNFLGYLQPDQDLRNDWMKLRFIAGGSVIRSSAVGIGATALAGTMSSVTVQDLPALRNLSFSTLPATRARENDVAVNIPVMNGLVTRSLPMLEPRYFMTENSISLRDDYTDGLNLYQELNNSRVYYMSPLVVTSRSSPALALGANNAAIVLNLPANSFGKMRVSVSIEVANAAATAVYSADLVANFAYANAAYAPSTSAVTIENIIGSIDPTSNRSTITEEVFIYAHAEITSIQLNITTGLAIPTCSLRATVELFDHERMCFHAPAAITILDNVPVGQQIAISGAAHYEAIPNEALVKNVKTIRYEPPHRNDADVAMEFMTNLTKFQLGTVMPYSSFLEMRQAIMHRITRGSLQQTLKMAWYDDLWKHAKGIAKAAFPAVGNYVGREFGIDNLGDQLSPLFTADVPVYRLKMADIEEEQCTSQKSCAPLKMSSYDIGFDDDFDQVSKTRISVPSTKTIDLDEESDSDEEVDQSYTVRNELGPVTLPHHNLSPEAFGILFGPKPLYDADYFFSLGAGDLELARSIARRRGLPLHGKVFCPAVEGKDAAQIPIVVTDQPLSLGGQNLMYNTPAPGVYGNFNKRQPFEFSKPLVELLMHTAQVSKRNLFVHLYSGERQVLGRSCELAVFAAATFKPLIGTVSGTIEDFDRQNVGLGPIGEVRRKLQSFNEAQLPAMLVYSGQDARLIEKNLKGGSFVTIDQTFQGRRPITALATVTMRRAINYHTLICALDMAIGFSVYRLQTVASQKDLDAPLAQTYSKKPDQVLAPDTTPFSKELASGNFQTLKGLDNSTWLTPEGLKQIVSARIKDALATLQSALVDPSITGYSGSVQEQQSLRDAANKSGGNVKDFIALLGDEFKSKFSVWDNKPTLVSYTNVVKLLNVLGTMSVKKKSKDADSGSKPKAQGKRVVQQILFDD